MSTKCKKRAVLVGCNYPNTINELSGCVNDAKAMREMIVSRFGFDSKNVELLTDEPGSTYKPTRANITAALKKMVVAAKEGDALLFHFSGHGVVDLIDPHQPSKKGEAIVPCDLNHIFDVDLGQLIQQLPSGSSFTIVSDSCHSGGLIDKSKEQIGPHSTLRGIAPPVDYKARGISLGTLFDCLVTAANVIIAAQGLLAPRAVDNAINTGTDTMTGIGSLLTTIFGNNVSLKFLPHYERDILNLRSLTEDEGILLSGCQANEFSIDMPASDKTGGKAFGAFTYTVLKVIKDSNGALTNKQLMVKARNEIIKLGIGQQHPCLYCSDENADAAFLGHQPNTTTGAKAAGFEPGFSITRGRNCKVNNNVLDRCALLRS